MLSVKHLPLPRAKASAVLHAVFGTRFLILQEGPAQRASPATAGPLVQHHFVALPPQHHLLLRCEVDADGTNVTAATDACQALSFLETRLDEELKAAADGGQPAFA